MLIPVVAVKIWDLLDQNNRYTFFHTCTCTCTRSFPLCIKISLEWLTWHDGVIPEEEIWVKLEGDKGGGSLTFSCSMSPNPTLSTFSAFQGQRHCDEPSCCFGPVCRPGGRAADLAVEVRIRILAQPTYSAVLPTHSMHSPSLARRSVFLSGDYLFLSVGMYRRSGSSGKKYGRKISSQRVV